MLTVYAFTVPFGDETYVMEIDLKLYRLAKQQRAGSFEIGVAKLLATTAKTRNIL